MFRLAHISDIHLGLEHVPSMRELASKRITGYVNWRRHRRKALFGNVLEALLDDIFDKKPDHLAITGDLVNLATDNEVEVATAWLEAIGDGLSTSVVPGNHDAYVPGAYDKVAEAWRSYMTSDDERLIRPDNGLFPFLRVRDNVALIGISTATATPPFVASGYFGIPQARRTVELLKQAKNAGLFRVVMIHHPPVRRAAIWHKRMIGIGRFSRVLRDAGAELVLHGHTHLNTIHWLPSPGGLVPVVGIASASQGPGGAKPTATYNYISIDGKPDDWQCRLERFQLPEDGGDKPIRISDDDLMRPETVPPGHIDPALGQDSASLLQEAIGERRHQKQAAQYATAQEPNEADK
jgi:3',5'-cyclic AMP phosphodiesterase CpdA